MEVAQENFLCSHLKQPEMSLSFFFFPETKSKQESRTGPAWGVVTGGNREEVEKW
jgi:hypothetical protein